MNEQEFRARLEDITAPRSKADAWLEQFEELRAEYAHSIRVANVAVKRGFNCFAFALGLTESSAYEVVASQTEEPNVFADDEFVTWLLQRDVLHPRLSVAEDTMVVYFSGAQPTHAGRCMASGRVLSKWGTGLYFSHELFEVPANYGETTAFFARPAVSTIEAAFLEFANGKNPEVERLVRNAAPHN